MIVPLEFVIAIVAALAVAIAIKLWRAERARSRAPIGKHDVLMKRAATHVDRSAFLKKACADYRKTGHLSARQVEGVENALERAERAKA